MNMQHQNMNALVNYDFLETAVRTAGTTEDPLYCVKDVCKCLGLQQKACHKTKILAEDDKHYVQVPDARGIPRDTAFCTQRGLRTIVSSINAAHILKSNPNIWHAIRDIRASKKKKVTSGFIYMLQNRMGDIVKVGKAKDCRKRWRSYQCTHNWVPYAAIRVEDMSESEARLIRYMHIHYQLSNGKEFFWCKNLKPVLDFMTKFGENGLSEI